MSDRGKRDRPSSDHLSRFALDRALVAAIAGDVQQALEWIERAPSDDLRVRAMEAELRYRHAAQLIAEGRYVDAQTHLNRVTKLAGLPQFLVDERLRLLRQHAAAMKDVAALRKRFGSECPACAGPDLFRIASCDHQAQPIPPVRKLSRGAHRPTISAVYAASAYRSGWDTDRNHPLTQLVRGQKSAILPEVMRLLGVLLADYIAYHTSLSRVVDLVVPVPTSRIREEIRGGSLPLSLASTLRDRLALPLVESIVQIGEHRDHTQAHGEERRRALRAAWRAIVDRRLRGRTVLLVDDIVTTGTTLRTAAELLREEGVADVYAVALLHTENST